MFHQGQVVRVVAGPYVGEKVTIKEMCQAAHPVCYYVYMLDGRVAMFFEEELRAL